MAVLFPLAKPTQRNFVCALKLLLQSHFKLLFLFVINISFGFVIIGDISLGVVKKAQTTRIHLNEMQCHCLMF